MDLGFTAILLGKGLEGIGQVTSGYETDLAAQFNAAVARANAQATQTSTDFDIARLRKAKRRFTSAQQAGYAKAGVKLEGSPIEVLIDSAADAQLDILITQYNSNMKQIGLNTQSEMLKLQGKQAVTQGYMGAASTLLSAVGSYYKGKT